MFVLFGSLNYLPMVLFLVKPEMFYFRAWEYYSEFAYKLDKPINWEGYESGDLRRKYVFSFREKWPTHVAVDFNGYRKNRNPNGPYHIVVSGDSLVFGSGLSNDETMPWRLSDYLGVPVFNGGRTSLLNNLQYSAIRGGDKIIIEAIAERNFTARRSFNNEKLSDPNVLFRPIAQRDTGLIQAIREVRQTLYTGAPIVVRFFRRLINDVIVVITNKDDLDYLFLEHAMKPTDLEQTVIAIKERNRIIRDMGFEYVVVPIPAKQTIYNELLDFDTKNYLPELISRLEADDINVINLVESFLQHKSEDLFFHYDTHWNPRGADLAAREIGQWIEENHGEVIGR